MGELLGYVVAFTNRDSLRIAIDIVDILLVAYVFYRVLLLIRGTRAMQMGIGLVAVFFLYDFAQRAGLITLWSILDRLLTYIVLIIVVLFQGDIRRALMRVGSRRWLRRGQSARESQVIEEVVKAASALAQKRIGALIVFERDAALDEFVEEGTKLDAAVTKELLYSIFVPSYENPMHDGAVVIRDGRLWQAGVFLPLTESTKLERTVGTRHRAALGISEESDAVVVVVSEERGSTSLCFGGNIVRDLDTNTLRQALVGLFDKPSAPKPKTTPKDRARRAKETTGRGSTPDGESVESSSPGTKVAEEAAP